MAAANLAIFWAKTDREKGTAAYHPLICHSIDVGMVTSAMWRALPLGSQDAIATSLGTNVDDASRWVSFLAALHDIGKLSPAFQLLDLHSASRLKARGFSSVLPPGKLAHGIISARVLESILLDRFAFAPKLGLRLATIVGGHHGIFPSDSAIGMAADDDVGRGRWIRARGDLADVLARVFEIPDSPPGGDLANPTAMLVAGLISVADWIGSNTRFFPFATRNGEDDLNLDGMDYAEGASQRANVALSTLGWLNVPIRPESRSFGELFPPSIIPVPNPVQRAAIEVADTFDEPGIVLVEVPMGEGKTEAALYLADCWATRLGQRGAYFALPTMATSNQMFTRVRDFLDRRYADTTVDLQLLHSHADLSADFAELKRNGERIFAVNDIADDPSYDGALPSVVAAEWFTHRRRGLLSPFGVGTVDQALLATLQTKHVFVRLFGLAHKTVIVDEVHAYDTYMSVLLERLLEWLAALGTSVVLLSATLPNSRSARLIAAYARGRGQLAAVTPPETCYPRVTWAVGHVIDARTVAASPLSTKNVAIRRMSDGLEERENDQFELGERLRASLPHGGCAAVVCNTVARAQAVYRALKRYFPGIADDGMPELGLLHARFPFRERRLRESQALQRFGKSGGSVTFGEGDERRVRRPSRAVLVATQIIEQSLDLDFDLMASDLAPLDLLLQRTGRLWRHKRERPIGLSEPTLWVLGPIASNHVPIFDTGSEAVYDRHVLLRSWLALTERDRLLVPENVQELIEAVYDDRPCPSTVSPEIRDAWRMSRGKRDEQAESDEHEAVDRWLARPDYPGPIAWLTRDAREEDAPSFHRAHQALTRLAEPSVPIICLHGTPAAPTLGPDGHQPIDLNAPPSVELTRTLLEQSLTVSSRRVVFDLMAQKPPSGWVRSPLLRQQRLLVLDRSRECSVGVYRVRLDPEIGLLVYDPRKERPFNDDL